MTPETLIRSETTFWATSSPGQQMGAVGNEVGAFSVVASWGLPTAATTATTRDIAIAAAKGAVDQFGPALKRLGE